MRIYASSKIEIGLQGQNDAEEEAVQRLLIRKQNLTAELEMARALTPSDGSTAAELDQAEPEIDLVYDDTHLKLCVRVDGTRIRALLIFAEGVLPNGESHSSHFHPPEASVKVALPLQRHLAVDLHIKILVECAHSEDGCFSVVEAVQPLPTFALVKWTNGAPQTYNFRVRFQLKERIQRVLNQTILFIVQLLRFRCLTGGLRLRRSDSG